MWDESYEGGGKQKMLIHAVDAYNKSTTSHYKDEFIGVDPYQITADLSKSRPLFSSSSSGNGNGKARVIGVR